LTRGGGRYKGIERRKETERQRGREGKREIRYAYRETERASESVESDRGREKIEWETERQRETVREETGERSKREHMHESKRGTDKERTEDAGHSCDGLVAG
jgi:hypothetical protein